MLSDSNADALLGKRRNSNLAPANQSASQISVSDQIPKNSAQPKKQSISEQPKQSSQTEKRKKKKGQAQFTVILKFFNIFLGLAFVGFGVFCYYDLNNDEAEQQNLKLIGFILPGYIAFSGLIILAVEMNIRFVTRNMRFLYNYFGRGFFNIYVALMPLALLDTDNDTKQDLMFQVAIYIIVSISAFVGAMYILAKVCCCAKEGDARKKQLRRKRRHEQSSGSSSDSD